MTPFFIASLPRSRTAWLANFLTFGRDSFCFHEPMNKVGLHEYPRLLQSVGTRYAGVSDSLNTLVMEELIDLFPEAKVVVIIRPTEEVAFSLNALGFDCPQMLAKMERELERIIYAYRPLVVDYHQFKPAEIWQYLFPDLPLNIVRLTMLEEFKITVPKHILINKGLELMTRAGDLLWPLIH